MGEEAWTLLRLLRWMTGYFTDKGVDNPRLDAELLLAHQLGLDRVGLYLNHDRPLTAVELDRIRPLVKRRGQREPLQYITGHTEFWSLAFEVTPAVLIPRADTEVLVEEALKRCGEIGSLLDVGTGSGVIAISVLRSLPGWQGLAIDISEEALRVAERNRDTLELSDRLQLVVGELSRLPEGPFELIVSNPPYIPTEQLPDLMPEVRDYEPVMALHGGTDGLDCYRHLVAQVGDCLQPGGWLLVEVGFDQADTVKALFDGAGLTETFIRRDYGGNPRVVGGRRS